MEVNVEVNAAADALALYRRVVQLVQAAAELQRVARQLLLSSAAASADVPAAAPPASPIAGSGSASAADRASLPAAAGLKRGVAVATRTVPLALGARKETTGGTRLGAARGARRSIHNAAGVVRAADVDWLEIFRALRAG